MNKKIKVIIAVGGTGGHVFPGCHLARHLIKKNYKVKLVTDSRGYKFLENFKDLSIKILPSSKILGTSLLRKFFTMFLIIFTIFRSIHFLIFNRPKVVFGMGGYASFPICIAASILRIKFIIYENNLIIGKANKYLLPFANKIIVSKRQVEGISQKFKYKLLEIGNIIDKEIFNFSINKEKLNSKKLDILVIGGSQAAKKFAELLPGIFYQCSENGIPIKIYQQCLKEQNNDLIIFYKKNKINFEIFNFSKNLINYFSKINLAITRSGSSVLAELTNFNIPFISVPLPTSADNHQFKNAKYYERKNLGFLIEEKELKNKLFDLLKEIHNNKSILDTIQQRQKQYSDKYVYENINRVLKEITYEKN